MRTLLLLALSIPAFAATCTSQSTGTWTGATWSCGHAPVAGDTVVLADSFTITIPASTTAVVGTSGAAGTVAISCSTTSGTGVLNVNGTLQIQGDVSQCEATWTYGPDSALVHDSSLASGTPAYVWHIGAKDNTVALLRSTSTNGHRFNQTNFAMSGDFGGFDDGGFIGGGQMQFQYANFTGCGTAATESVSRANRCVSHDTNGPSTYAWSCNYCSFTGSGVLWLRGDANSQTYSITHTSFFSPTRTDKRTMILTFSKTTALWTINYIYSEGPITLETLSAGNVNLYVHDWILNSQVAGAGNYFVTIAPSQFNAQQWSNMFSYSTACQTSMDFPGLQSGSVTRIYGVRNCTTGGQEPYFLDGPKAYQGAQILDGFITESVAGSGNSSGGGDSSNLGGTYLKKNGVVLPPPTEATQYMNAVHLKIGPGASSVSTVQNNTYFARHTGSDATGGSGGGGWEAGLGTTAGGFAAMTDNIAYCLTTCATGALAYSILSGSTFVQDGSYNGLDYNWTYNFSNVGGGGNGGYQNATSGVVRQAKYVSGATVTGSANQTCNVGTFNGGGSSAAGTIALTGTDTIAASTMLSITAGGSGYSASPTTAVLTNGTATCSGTITIVSATNYYTSPSPPGTHDQSGNPQFTDTTRKLLTWCTLMDASVTTLAGCVSEFGKVNNDSGFNPKFTPMAAYEWVRLGFRVNNPTTFTAGHAGGPVGAEIKRLFPMSAPVR